MQPRGSVVGSAICRGAGIPRCREPDRLWEWKVARNEPVGGPTVTSSESQPGVGDKTTLQGVGGGARPRRSEMVHSVAEVAVVMPSFEAQLQNVSADSGRQTDREQQRQGKHR